MTLIMRAVFIERFGRNDVLKYGEFPKPSMGPHQVLIRVHAAGVNPRDWLVRGGRYPFKFALPKFPFVLGSDVAGEIAEVGDKVSEFAVGDKVYGMQVGMGKMGAYAEYISIDVKAVAAIPSSLSFEEAAGIPCAGLTAWQSLHQLAALRADMSVTIIGASGGVGSYAVQLAVAAGANVTAVCSGRNVDFVRSLGARQVVDYRAESYADVLRGQDIVLDAIGKDGFQHCRPLLKTGGTYITTVPSLGTFAHFFGHNLLFNTQAKIVTVKARGSDLCAMNDLVMGGQLKTVIAEVFDLADAADALAQSRTFRTRGKIILRVS